MMTSFTPLLGVTTYAESWWIQIIKSLIIFGVGFNLIPVALMLDRKVMGRMQNRTGPSRVGPYGILTPIADIGKLAGKADFRPRSAIGWLFRLAPILSIITAVVGLAIIPFGPVVNIFGTDVGLYGMDVSIGPLFVFAFGALAFYGVMLGGWSSGSKYSFLGSMRAAAQLISYEVSQSLAIVGVLMTSGTLSMTGIVEAQRGMWFFIPQFVGFLIFMLASFAEAARPPFDTTEADGELVGGYITEFGGGGFAAYFLAEYAHMVVISGLTVTFFFGGYLLPFGIDPPAFVYPIVVLVKIMLFVNFFVWVRATLPRLRYDQLMTLGWKFLLPLATANALVTAIIVVATN